MFKQIFELFKSDSLQEQALTECYEMLEIVREMYNESVKTLRHSDTTEIPIDIYKTGVLLKKNNILPKKTTFYMIERLRSQDINYPEDLKFINLEH